MAFVRETGSSNVDATVSGTLDASGLITATAGIKLGNNIIYASDGASTITLDASNDNVTFLGDIKLDGGDILNSQGETTITINDDQLTTLTGDLVVSGNDITFGNGESINNNVNGDLRFVSPEVIVYGVGESAATKFQLWSKGGEDTQIIFSEEGDAGDVNKWIVGHDADASSPLYPLCFMSDSSTPPTAINATTAELRLDNNGDMTIAGDLTANGGDISIVGAEGGNASLALKGDEGDDAGDEWQILVNQSNQHISIGNDIASAGTYVSMLEITPHATATSSLVQIAGDLEVNGGRITFENDEYIHNESDGIVVLNSATKVTMETALLKIDGQGSGTCVLDIDSIAGQDSKLYLSENGSVKWSIGNDADDDDIHIGTSSTVGDGNSKFSMSTTGMVTVAGGVQTTAVSRTATDDGSGTGTIAAGTSFVSVDADSDANHILILPAPVVGNVIYISETGTTGYELRSSNPSSIGINGGTGSNAESAVAGAVTYIKCVCVSSTSWICSQYVANGTESALAAAS